MKTINFDNYILIELSNSSNLNMLLKFLNQYQSNCPNIIINLLKSNLDKTAIVSKLFRFHVNWEKRNKSFILVSNIRKELLKSMISIRTLEEAIDFFHMEELTRNIN